MLANVKLLLGITGTDKDALLNLLIGQATDDALAFLHREELPAAAESAVTQMVVYRYNRIGTEGAASESYDGISYSYNQDYPESILYALRPLRKLVMI